jgi:hypothetical protein
MRWRGWSRRRGALERNLADSRALARVLERLQNLNVLPRRIHVALGSTDHFHIEVDVFGVGEAQRRAIAAKVHQAVCVINAYWHSI